MSEDQAERPSDLATHGQEAFSRYLPLMIDLVGVGRDLRVVYEHQCIVLKREQCPGLGTRIL